MLLYDEAKPSRDDNEPDPDFGILIEDLLEDFLHYSLNFFFECKEEVDD